MCHMVSWDFFIQMRTTMAGHVGVGDFGDGAVGVGDDGDADHRIFHIFSTSHFTISPRHISNLFHDFPTSHFRLFRLWLLAHLREAPHTHEGRQEVSHETTFPEVLPIFSFPFLLALFYWALFLRYFYPLPTNTNTTTNRYTELQNVTDMANTSVFIFSQFVRFLGGKIFSMTFFNSANTNTNRNIFL